MSCDATAQGTPSWLTLRSYIASSIGRCSVQASGEDRHIIWAENLSSLPYVVEVESKCSSPKVRYADEEGSSGPQPDWKTSFPVPICPGRKRRDDGEANADRRLTSLGPANSQNIVAKLTWKIDGDASASNSENLTAQVTTR